MSAISGTKKGKGRPRSDSERVVVRLPPRLLGLVDAEAKASGLGRPGAVRRLLERIVGADPWTLAALFAEEKQPIDGMNEMRAKDPGIPI